MSVEYHHVVIHHLRKEPKQQIQKPIIKDVTLNSDSESVHKLVDGVIKLYGTKDNNSIFGTFSDDEDFGYFPANFESFRAGSQTEGDFISLTKVAMNSLQNKAGDVNFASGGYILFASYSMQGKPYFLVAMIKQREGLQLNDDLEPIGIQELDLNKLHQAARINIHRYLEHEQADVDEKEQFSYLSFVSPRSNQSASGYFIKALGCSGGVASSRATDSAIVGMSDFFNKDKNLKIRVKELKAGVCSYLRDCCDEKRPATVTDLTGLARNFLPTGYSEEQRNKVEEDLASYLNSDDKQVPAEFRVHLATVNKKARVKLKTANWQVQFEKHSFGFDENAEVWYDKDNERLIFNNITNEMKSIFMDEK